MTLTPLNGAVCPGLDLEYSCNSTVSFNVLWRQIGVDEIISDSTLNVQNFTLGNFMIQIVSRTFAPNSIVSTATLKNALFSHANVSIECLALNVNLIMSDSVVVLVSGEFLYQNS